MDSEVQEEESDSKKFKCGVCSAVFKKKTRFMRHYISHRSQNLRSIFICNICSHGFTDKGDLDAHQVSHKQIVPTYNCTQCNRKFVLKRQFEQHKNRCNALLTPVKNDDETRKFLSNLKSPDCSEKDFSYSSARVDVIEKRSFSEDFEQNEFQLSFKQTFSGRTVKMKKICDVNDNNSNNRRKSVSIECNNTGNEDSSESFKSSVLSDSSKISGKELKILLPKLSDHIYEKCFKDGSVSLSAFSEADDDILQPMSDLNNNDKTSVTFNTDSNVNLSCNKSVTNVASKCKKTEDLPKRVISNVSKKLNLRCNGNMQSNSLNALPNHSEMNQTFKDMSSSAKQDIISKVFDENFFFRNKHLLCAGKEVEELIISSKSVAEKLTNKAKYSKMQYQTAPSVCNQNNPSMLIKKIDYGDQQIQILKVSNSHPSINVPQFVGQSKKTATLSQTGILHSYLLGNKMQFVKVTPEFMNQLQKTTIEKESYCIRNQNITAKHTETFAVEKMCPITGSAKIPFPKSTPKVTLVSPVITSPNVCKSVSPFSIKSSSLQAFDKNVVNATQNLRLQGSIQRLAEKNKMKRQIEKREIILNKCLARLRSKDERKIEKFKLKRRLRYLEKFFKECRNRLCDDRCWEYLPSELINTSNQLIEGTELIMDIDQSAHHDEIDPFAMEIQEPINNEISEKNSRKCTCNSKDCDWSQHTMEEDKLSFVELADELTLKPSDLMTGASGNVSPNICKLDKIPTPQKCTKEKMYNKMLDVNEKIRKNLSVSNTNIKAALEAMRELEELDLTSGMWKKSLVVLQTIKACKKFKKDEAVRKKANCIYEKFKQFYLGQTNSF